MKKLKYIIILVISFFSFLNISKAATNPYSKWQTLHGVTTIRCTWYAWDQAYNLGGVALPSWGNAQSWYSSAKNAGYSVGREAKPNSIAVYSSSDNYGHVSYVVSVNGNIMYVNEGGVYTTEYYACPDNPDEFCYINTPEGDNGIVNNNSRPTTDDDLIGFIYLDDAPKTSTNNNSSNNSSNTTNNSSNNKTTTTKSSNNYLQELIIDGIDISFNKERLEYEVEVPYETKIIKISATVEDSKASVTGTGEKALEIGENNYEIIVKAENSDERIYSIKVIRKEKEEIINNLESEQDSVIDEKSNNKLIIILAISGVILLGVIIGIIVLIKKHKKTNN